MSEAAEPLIADSEPDEPTDALDEAVTNSPQPYCKPGFRGLFASRYVTLCAAFATIGGLLFGYDQGVVSVILVEQQFLGRFGQVADDAPGSGFWKGLLTAMIELGALLGALNQGWLADRYSRKYSIVLAVGVFIVGSVLQTAAMDYTMLVVARFIGGVGIGMLSMVCPMYVAEISPPEIRGTLLVLEELSIVTGIVVAFWITYATRLIDSEWAWRFPFLLQVLPGLILAIGALSLPFSPRWLASKGRYKETLSTLSTLRQLPPTDPRVHQEYTSIKAETFQQTTSTTFLTLLQPAHLPRTHIALLIPAFQQWVGINALIYYAPTLLTTLHLPAHTRLLFSGFLNMAQLLGVTSAIWSMDALGRRPLLLIGSLAMCLSHTLLAILTSSSSSSSSSTSSSQLTPSASPSTEPDASRSISLACLFIYMIFFGATWGPVGWTIPGEIFGSSVRAKGVALATASNWFNNFVIGLVTPPLVQRTGSGVWVFFAVFCALSLVWTWFVVPETKGRTLEDMDRIFTSRPGSATNKGTSRAASGQDVAGGYREEESDRV